MPKYIRDDIYFCPDCRQFHNSDSHTPVEVPGMDEFYDPDTGKTYKVKKPRYRKKTPKKGFAS